MTYLTAVSMRGSGSISLRDIEALVAASPEFLMGSGLTAERWAASDCLTHIIRWGQDGAGVETEHGCALAVAGYWTHSGYGGDVNLMRALERSDNPDALVASLGGVFVLMFYSARRCRLYAWNTVACAPPLYQASTKGGSILATSKALVLKFCGPSSYSPEGVVAFVAFDRHFGLAGSGCPDIHLAEPATCVTLAHGTVKTWTYTDDWNRYGCGTEPLTPALLDEMADVAIQSVRTISRRGAIRLGLSGGRDSRLLAAALDAAGVEWGASTSGWPNHPDVILAKRIAHLLGRPIEQWRTKDDADGGDIQTTDLGREFLRTVALYDGMHSPVPVSPTQSEVENRLNFQKAVEIAGNPGECLRGGQAILVYGWDRDAVKTFDEALEIIRAPLRQTEVYHPAPLHTYNEMLNEWAVENFDPEQPTAIFERAYLYNFRTRFSPIDCGDTIYPLADAALLRLAHCVRFEYRYREILIFELIRRLAPKLADIPPAERRWGFETNGPHPDYLQGYEARAPVPLAYTERVGNPIYYQAGVGLRGVLKDIILQSEALSAISSGIRPDWLKQTLNSRALFDPGKCLLVWAAMGAQGIVSGKWLDWKSVPEKLAQADVGVQWNYVFQFLTDAVLKYETCQLFEQQHREARLRSLMLPASVSVVPECSFQLRRCDTGFQVSIPQEKAGRWLVVPMAEAADVAGESVTMEFSLQASRQVLGSAHLCYTAPDGTPHRIPYLFNFGRTRERHCAAIAVPPTCTKGNVEFWLPLVNQSVEIEFTPLSIRASGRQSVVSREDHIRAIVSALKPTFGVHEVAWSRFLSRRMGEATIGEFIEGRQTATVDASQALFEALGVTQ